MKWTDEIIKEELLKSIKILNLERMPTGEELKSIGRNDLHCKLGRTKKYSGWAEHLGLQLKKSETNVGQKWEQEIARQLENRYFQVELMTTKHPYDILVDDVVKIDVKVANPYMLRGKDRVHTFALHKVNPTCDVYILVVLNEEEKVERTLIIPSHHVKMKMINIGRNSKYNRYDNQWGLITKYSRLFLSI